MTQQEITKALIKYATEDTQIAKNDGMMAVTGTKSGVITLVCENDVYQAFNRIGEALTGGMNRVKMINWLTVQYIVEIEA